MWLARQSALTSSPLLQLLVAAFAPMGLLVDKIVQPFTITNRRGWVTQPPWLGHDHTSFILFYLLLFIGKRKLYFSYHFLLFICEKKMNEHLEF